MAEGNGNRKLITVIIGLMALFLTIAGTAWMRANGAAEAVSLVREKQGVIDSQIIGIADDIKEIKGDVKQLLRE